MNCQDVAKLRTPLDAVCQTTDIGCVPIVTGKPTCSPQPDELPIAYDKTTSTLWLFSCDTREWLAFGKFSICELSALNLDNIRNICDVLNIAVNYSGSGECVQGTVTLGELAQRIFECLQLETKIVTIGQGEGNKVKISIDGLPLDPVYVQGRNIWSEGGSGTESDPLVVATYDPICEWPVKTQAQVDAASSKHLGACIDGQMSRVPFPPKVCELPARNQAQVDAARSVELAACVDGQGVKIPYIKPSPPVCNANQITLEQASARGSNLTLVACDNGNTVRIPVSGSGFFDRDYICVPSVTAAPSGAPVQGTGPFRVGCNGELYAWLCESDGSGRWVEIRYNMNSLSSLNPNNVSDLCNNFRMMGWYSNTSGDPCVQEVKFTLQQLVAMIERCQETKNHVKYVPPSDISGGMCIAIGIDQGVPTGVDDDILFGYSLRDGAFVFGGSSTTDTLPKGHLTLNITNPFPERALLEINGVVAAFTGHRYGTIDEFSTTVYADFSSSLDSPPPWTSGAINNDSDSIIIQPTPLGVEIQDGVNDLYNPGKALGPVRRMFIDGNQTITVYGSLWFLGICPASGATVVMHARMNAGYTIYRYAF